MFKKELTTTEAWKIGGLIFLAFLLIALAIVFGPLIVIWALNTLFPVLAINFSFWTWLAVAVLNVTYFSTFMQINNKMDKILKVIQNDFDFS